MYQTESHSAGLVAAAADHERYGIISDDVARALEHQRHIIQQLKDAEVRYLNAEQARTAF